MEFLLALGAKVNAVDTDGDTPLFWTVYKGHPKCTKVLLAAGATVNHRNSDGRTPLDMTLRQYQAAIKVRAKIVKVLEAAGGLRAVDLPDEDDSDK